MTATIYWDKIEADVTDFIKACTTYQRIKKNKQKYGKLLPQDVSTIPWDIVCKDIMGTYTGIERFSNGRIMNAMSFVDSATNQFERTEILDKTSARISQISNNTWLTRYL